MAVGGELACDDRDGFNHFDNFDNLMDIRKLASCQGLICRRPGVTLAYIASDLIFSHPKPKLLLLHIFSLPRTEPRLSRTVRDND